MNVKFLPDNNVSENVIRETSMGDLSGINLPTKWMVIETKKQTLVKDDFLISVLNYKLETISIH